MKQNFVKILLIDDEPDLLEVSKQFLELDNIISADTAPSADHALELIELQDYDVIVSDYQMPNKNGIQLLKEIRATGNNIPFILFTGRGREEVAIEALNNGANFYLQKGGDITSQFAELGNMVMQAHSRKKGEQALIISEERYRSLFENSIDAVLLTTIDGNILSANPSACQMLGLTEPDIKKIGRDGILINDHNWKITHHRLKKTGVASGEFTFRRKDGTTLIGETSSGLFIGLDGNAKISMIIRDTTEKNKIKEKMEASELRYRRLFETAQDGILILDYKTEKIIDANKFILDLTGYSLDDTIGKNLWELGFIKDVSLAEKAFSELRTNKYVRYENIPLRRKNGETVEVEFISNVYAVKGTEIVQCNIREVSESQLLDRIKKELARIVDSSDDAIIGQDINGTVVSWNNGAERIFGYSSGEIVDRSRSLMPRILKMTCKRSL
jgi:PAS domain S-box-containing protein